MPAIGVAVGVVLGLFAGGRLSNLPAIRLRWLPLVLAAAALRFALEVPAIVPDSIATFAIVPTYLALALGLLANRRLPGMSAAAIGVAANGLAIAANAGKMPVWGPALDAAGLGDAIVGSARHTYLPDALNAEFVLRAGPLSDLIPIAPIHAVISIGDFLLAAGLGAFVFAALVRAPAIFAVDEAAWTPSVSLPAHPFVRLGANGSFSAVWLAQVVSSLGDRVHQIALVFLVVQASDRPEIAVGLAFAASVIPTFIVGPFAGAIADRSSYKATLIASDLGRAALAIAIPVVAGVNVWLVLPVVFLLASLSAFFRPARSALLPSIVEERDLVSANSALWIADTIMDTAGYAFAGLFVAYLGQNLALAFWVDGASYVISALLVATIAVREVSRRAESATPSIARAVVQGWQFLRHETVLFVTTVQAVFAQASAGATIALSPFVMAALATAVVGKEEAYGYLEAAIGVGAIGGGVAIGSLGERVPKGPTIAVAYVVLGVSTIGLAVAPSIPLALLAGVVLGIANVAFVVPSQTLFQLRTPPEMLARVVAIRLALVNGVLAVAMVGGGFLAIAFGVPAVLTVAGVATVVAGVAGFFVRAIREA